jgi:hypothetical protein
MRIRGQLQHERLDELRLVLDTGVAALAGAQDRLRSAELLVERSQASDAEAEDASDAEEAIGNADRALRDVSEQRLRTSIRLGPSTELVVTYGLAYEALVDELEVLRSAFLGGPLSDDPKGWKEVVVPLNQARERFGVAQRSVSELAANLIGPFSET